MKESSAEIEIFAKMNARVYALKVIPIFGFSRVFGVAFVVSFVNSWKHSGKLEKSRWNMSRALAAFIIHLYA